jgi:diphthine synthase
MLYLIGLGLDDEKDLTLKAIETAKKCECYCELYTSIWKGSLEGLKQIIGKDIKLLKRKDLEENAEILLEEAKQKDIAVFVPGDPLAATTHFNLAFEARRKRIPVKIIHNASIFSAVGETGLQLYKFGKTATIPLNGKMENVKKTVKDNKKLGLHSLLLLDVDNELNINMNVPDALKLLLKNRIASQFDQVVAFSNAGGDSKVFYDTVKNLTSKNINLPAVIIIPSKMHFRERDFLELV